MTLERAPVWQGSCEGLCSAREHLLRVPNQIIWNKQNEHQRHFESSTASREAVKTRVLIAHLDRIVQILNGDIAAEEEQAGIFDVFHPEYPMLARALAARRDNLTDTIAALEQRVATIKEPPFALPPA
jgi:hypothetical protein